MKKISLALIIAIASIGLFVSSMGTQTDKAQSNQVSNTASTTNTQLLSDEDLQKKIKARR